MSYRFFDLDGVTRFAGCGLKLALIGYAGLVSAPYVLAQQVPTILLWQYRAAGPYAYSEMTGFVTLGSTFSSGSWTFVHDEGTLNRVWNKIAWNGTTPYGTGIRVEVRASNILTELPNLPFVALLNDQQISNVSGRYLEVRVTLHRQPLIAETPVLYDLTVRTP